MEILEMSCASFHTHFNKSSLTYQVFTNLGTEAELKVKFCGFEQSLRAQQEFGWKNGPNVKSTVGTAAGQSVGQSVKYLHTNYHEVW